MGASPKKKSSSTDQGHVNNIKKLCIAAVLCFAVYFITKPSSTNAPSLSSHPIERTAGKIERTAGKLNDRSTNNLGFWNKPSRGEFSPQIAWLMSYPNSGTSFTMTCTERTSNLSTATNYGDEVTASGDYSLSIYPRHPEGPFWEGLSGKLGAIRPLPERYVLVKTHCGSRCVDCDPAEYVETYESFVDACRSSSGRVAPDRLKEQYLYPMDRVKKAIHLIRNPFHNFVSRYHLVRKNNIAKGKRKEEWVERHPLDAIGFQRWCNELDEMYKKEEDENFEHDMVKQLRLSPCHGEVLKFIQWHNLAFQLTQRHGIESLVVYYEDYASNFNQTLDTILDFLELPTVLKPRGFEAGHEYNKFYTSLDKRRIQLLVQEIASETTWNHLEHYFDHNTSFYGTDLSEDQVPKDVKKIGRQSGSK